MEKMQFQNLTNTEQENIQIAIDAQQKAYAPYSHFPVGALAISKNNKKFSGCNIESADFTLTSHAEMTAINNMVSHGEQCLQEIYIVLSAKNKIPVPCGLCRQKISEFAENEQIPIYTIDNSTNDITIYKFTLTELYPYPFSKNFL